MLRQLLFLLLGGLLGHFITRHYNAYKTREDEAHAFRLALADIVAFEKELLLRYVMPNWDGPPNILENVHIKKFMETKLYYILLADVRDDLIQIAEWIDQLNEKASPFTGKTLPTDVANSFVEEARNYQCFYDGQYSDGKKTRILNSLLYSMSWRYRLAGLKPTKAEIRRSRSPRQLVYLHQYLEAPSFFPKENMKEFLA